MSDLNLPSLHWHYWFGGRKGIRPVKNWVVRCWRGYQSGAMCRLAYGPADATATHCLLLQKIQIGFTFLVPAHPDSPGKGPLNGRMYVHKSGTLATIKADKYSRSMQTSEPLPSGHKPLCTVVIVFRPSLRTVREWRYISDTETFAKKQP